MRRRVEAIFENGVLVLDEPLDLPEHQRVVVTVDAPAEINEDALEAWLRVYEGLSQEEVSAVEQIALDRGNFMQQ